jgi:hypothetical protein
VVISTRDIMNPDTRLSHHHPDGQWHNYKLVETMRVGPTEWKALAEQDPAGWQWHPAKGQGKHSEPSSSCSSVTSQPTYSSSGEKQEHAKFQAGHQPPPPSKREGDEGADRSAPRTPKLSSGTSETVPPYKGGRTN